MSKNSSFSTLEQIIRTMQMFEGDNSVIDVDNSFLQLNQNDFIAFDSEIYPKYNDMHMQNAQMGAYHNITHNMNQMMQRFSLQAFGRDHYNQKRVRWTEEEDQKLKQAVDANGPKKWEKIAESLPNRTAKQCRERWIVHFDSNFNHDPWTKEEDNMLIEYQNRYGNKFSTIAKKMSKRSSIQIKNRWKYLKKHNLHVIKEEKQNLDVFDQWEDEDIDYLFKCEVF